LLTPTALSFARFAIRWRLRNESRRLLIYIDTLFEGTVSAVREESDDLRFLLLILKRSARLRTT
jgi:hypothetical protein